MIASLGSRNNGLIPTVGLLFLAILSCSIWLGGTHCQAQDTSTQDAAPQSKSRFAGPTDSGFLLPNGWHLTPAGKQVDTSDLLLNIFPMKDSRRAVVATSGFNEHQLGIVDLDSGEFLSKQVVHQSWFGLAVAPDESRLWWSGGGFGRVHQFQIDENQLIQTSEKEPSPFELSRKELAEIRTKLSKEKSFKSGLAWDSKRKCLYALNINQGKLLAINEEGQTVSELDLGGRPYDVQISPRNGLLYVSDWSERRILVIDPHQMTLAARILVGEHPNQLAFHPTDDRLFVSCGSSNGVWVIDTKRGVVTETIMTSLFPLSPEGSTPDALAVSPDGSNLLVANADNNCIAVVDVTAPSRSQVKGFIPTGWYPTSERFRLLTSPMTRNFKSTRLRCIATAPIPTNCFRPYPRRFQRSFQHALEIHVLSSMSSMSSKRIEPTTKSLGIWQVNRHRRATGILVCACSHAR